MFELNVEKQKLIEEVVVLKAQLSSVNDWENEKSRYVLMSPWSGSPVSVYHLLEANSKGENPHWLCPNCFHQKKKSVLNTNQKRVKEFILIVQFVKHQSILAGMASVALNTLKRLKKAKWIFLAKPSTTVK